MSKLNIDHFIMNGLIVLVLLVFSTKTCAGLEVRPLNFKKNEFYCERMSKTPYFDIDLTVGKTPWRIYHTWNMELENKCLDMTIKNATPNIVDRFYTDIRPYLESEPVWDAAALHVKLGLAKHELLLFIDQGPAGSLLGVPNVMKGENLTPHRESVPLLKFFMKLLQDGKYLLLMDCRIGVSSLMCRDKPPNRREVTLLANSLDLGRGTPACLIDKKDPAQYKID